MDSDTDDASDSTGSTSALRVAEIATLQQVQVPARVFLRKARPWKAKTILSRKSRMRAQRPSYATLQLKLLGSTFEPFAKLSPPFREFSPAVFLHHASPWLCTIRHGFLDDSYLHIYYNLQCGRVKSPWFAECLWEGASLGKMHLSILKASRTQIQRLWVGFRA